MIRPLLSTLALFACFAGAVPAQGGEPPPEPKREKVEWPKPDATEEALIHRLWRKVGAATDDEKRAAAEEELSALGAKPAPFLLRQLGAKHPRHPDSARRILDRVLEPRHAPLLVEHVRTDGETLRHYVGEKLARWHGAVDRTVLQGMAGHEDPEIAFFGALGLTASGDPEGVDAVFERSKGDWHTHADLVAELLPAARSTDMAELVLAHMHRDDERACVAGLRLMRSLAPVEYGRTIATFLDAQQHTVKKEAINALRAVVDGQPPLEELSVFQAIDLAKKWKARLQ